MRIVIVDDDHLLRTVMVEYLERDVEPHQILECASVAEVSQCLKTGHFDLIFLDLQLPDGGGDALLPTLSPAIQVIIVTAHQDFAVRSYEYDVCDYLVKPLSPERVYRAVEKARKRLTQNRKEFESPSETGALYFRSSGSLVKRSPQRVSYIKSEGNFLRVVGDDPNILTLMTMTKVLTLLPDYFLRAHRSYVVNRHRITEIRGGSVHLGTVPIRIGESYKSELIKALGLDPKPGIKDRK